MTAPSALLLSAALAVAAPAARTPLPPTDMALDMRARMGRIEPDVKALRGACERLLALVPGYAAGGDPDAPGLGRAATRRDVETAGARLKDAVGDFWTEAETLRVATAAEYFMRSASGERPPGLATAATILEPPAFPRTAMHLHQLSLLVLHHEEGAYRAARERRAKERKLWVGLALGGLALGALLCFAATEFVWSRAPWPAPSGSGPAQIPPPRRGGP